MKATTTGSWETGSWKTGSSEAGSSEAGPWEERQAAFVARLAGQGTGALEQGTVVVVPSMSFATAELRKITGAVHYEERMLFTALFLRSPELRLVYVTSLPVEPAVVDYYLRFLPDPADARRRLTFVDLGDGGADPLTHKLVRRPDAQARIRAAVGDPDGAYVLSFNVTASERALSEALGLPLYGPPPHLAALGSKTGSRRTGRRAGVSVLFGVEDLWSLAEVERGVETIRAHSPHAEAAVVKLNNGFSGQGNAIVELHGPNLPVDESKTTFCCVNESWSSFAAKIEAEGAIVEELIRREPVVSPSVQVRIAAGGLYEVLSTHDQVLGGPEGQVYLGCRFPADPEYRLAIQRDAMKVAGVLAGQGVIGSFGIDFLVAHGHGGNAVYLSEINLRLGGTTHPYWMARLATGGAYDVGSGELLVGGQPRRYVATDNFKFEELVGRSAADIVGTVDRSGLAFDPATATGVTLHLMGAVHRFGKMGATCIAPTLDEADALYTDLEVVLRKG